MADAQNIIKIILLLPGEQAARIRTKASEVFVRFLGGDATLVQDVMRNRELQHVLRQRDPDHWARLFGEHVEQAESLAAAPGAVQQDLVHDMAQRACEAVVQATIPAIERVLGACYLASRRPTKKTSNQTNKRNTQNNNQQNAARSRTNPAAAYPLKVFRAARGPIIKKDSTNAANA